MCPIRLFLDRPQPRLSLTCDNAAKAENLQHYEGIVSTGIFEKSPNWLLPG
jgi:hypothetical protein